MNPQLFFGIGGAIVGLWGLTIAVFNQWAQKLGGDRLANGRPLTPGFVRFIGVVLAIGGTLFVILAITGVLPDHE
ncbi:MULTISPECIES: hypothetical protein [unclassified Curtobacterium]|uniref:hypothetical protein n=1 Tax=unclassified Curtobacterium TaxID=257496 RepID=UPI001046227E|nr:MULTISPECIES: hypothetical protein [unclassified Curtobacterium]TCL79668.1 hypothetical protein EDF23_10258 [Curtobacterium sp. PhB128]TCL98158.1 hypothetical protein EDF29_102392 [Curtobacterium sp. PhB138]